MIWGENYGKKAQEKSRGMGEIIGEHLVLWHLLFPHVLGC